MGSPDDELRSRKDTESRRERHSEIRREVDYKKRRRVDDSRDDYDRNREPRNHRDERRGEYSSSKDQSVYKREDYDKYNSEKSRDYEPSKIMGERAQVRSTRNSHRETSPRQDRRRGDDSPPRRRIDPPPASGSGFPPPPVSTAPGNILRGTIQGVRPFGVFVRVPGLPRDVMVHHSQVSENVQLSKQDDDEIKVKALEFVCTRGQEVYVKLLGGDQAGDVPRISGSLKAVDQETGADLDPAGLSTSADAGAVPEVGTILKAAVRRVEPYGIFVGLDGFGRRMGLVHGSQVSNYLTLNRSDSDEEKRAELLGVVGVGDPVWVKVVEVIEDDAPPLGMSADPAATPRRGPRIGCSMKLVNQSNGEDLDPGGTRYRPRDSAPAGQGGGGGPGFSAAGAVSAGRVDWGHLAGDTKLYAAAGASRYELLEDTGPELDAQKLPPPPPLPPSRYELKGSGYGGGGGAATDMLLAPDDGGGGGSAALRSGRITTVEEALAIIEQRRQAKRLKSSSKQKKKEKKKEKRKKAEKEERRERRHGQRELQRARDARDVGRDRDRDREERRRPEDRDDSSEQRGKERDRDRDRNQSLSHRDRRLRDRDDRRGVPERTRRSPSPEKNSKHHPSKAAPFASGDSISSSSSASTSSSASSSSSSSSHSSADRS